MAEINILEHVVTALVSGGGSFVAAARSAVKKYKKLEETVDEHEDGLRELREGVAQFFLPHIQSATKELKQALSDDTRAFLYHRLEEFRSAMFHQFEENRRALRFEADSFKGELQDTFDRRVRDMDSPTNPGFKTLNEYSRRIEVLERQLERYRDKFVTTKEFSEFSAEQQQQWTETNRTLGQIMGALKIKTAPRRP